jgi:sugar phosphate isomerase/epimerase
MKFSTGAWIDGATGDRFVRDGYREGFPCAERLKRLAKVDGLSGIELNYPADLTDDNMSSVKKTLVETGLKCVIVGVDLTCQRKWQFGSVTSSDPQIRKEAIELTKKAMDIAADLGAGKINFWLGQDGYDYCFQVDYDKMWTWLLDAIKECADYRKDVKICLEYKMKEPRTHTVIATVGKALLLALQSGRENVGVTVDVGHALQAGENVAESVVLLNKYGKLFHFHMNDNYRLWDDDMVVGSVHFLEYLELLYILKKINFDDWYSFDVYPYREDPLQVVAECIKYIKGLDKLLDRIGTVNIEKALQDGDAVGALGRIRQAIMPD